MKSVNLFQLKVRPCLAAETLVKAGSGIAEGETGSVSSWDHQPTPSRRSSKSEGG